MRRTPWVVVLPVAVLGLCAFVACVGDDPATNTVSPDDGGTNNGDGSTTGDGASPPNPDGGGSDGGADAGPPPCGYPGESCCEAPLVACRAGTTCSTGTKKCLVDDAWVVGEYSVSTGGFPVDRAVTAHYDGTGWTRGPDVPTDWRPQAIYQASPTSVRIISFHNNDQGGKMFYRFSPTEFRECAPFGACPTPLLSSGKLVDFYGITNVDNEFWLGGVNQLYRCASGATSCVSTTTGTSGTWAFGNFAGTTATDLWYSAIDRAFHYDGTTWTVHSGLQAYSIYQVRKNDTWVGTKTLQHWNGAAWSSAFTVDGNPTPGSIFSIGGSATDDLWAAGNENNDPSFTAHWNGTAWSLVALPAAAKFVQSLWAPSKTEAFVVGANAGIFKWNGTAWSQVTSPQITPAAGETIVSPLRWVSVHGLARPRP